MPTWKAGGYVIRLYVRDHPPLHVHVFKESREVARYDLEGGRFLAGSEERHMGRVRRALRNAGLID
jgi:hypothetical protein